MSLDLDTLREKLIASVHSDEEAKRFFESRLQDSDLLLSLCAVCAPYDCYSNDCRMEAAYWISKYSGEELACAVPLLLVLVTIPSEGGEDMNGNIACHLLAAIRSATPYFKGTIYQNLDAISEMYGCKNG